MLSLLDQTLKAVPMLATLGVRAEEARTGHVVLRLPVAPPVQNYAGALHSSAVFALGELAAAVVLQTHPELTDLEARIKSSRVKYYGESHQDVTAHAEVTPEMLEEVRVGLRTGSSTTEVPVVVLDGHGHDVAQLITRFSFHLKGSP